MTSFQWFTFIGGLTLATANIVWLSLQVRKLWFFNVKQAELMLQITKSNQDIDTRLSLLETDGK